MAGTEPEPASFGEVLDEIKQGTNYELAKSNDSLTSLVGTSRRAISGQLGQSQAELTLQLGRMRDQVGGEIDQSAGMYKALAGQARRAVTSAALASQGAANLYGLISAPTAEQLTGQTCGPCETPVADPIYPNSFFCRPNLNQPGCDGAGGSGGGAIDNVQPPIQPIDNTECPPQEPCPPCPPCPPPPEQLALFSFYHTRCRFPDLDCAYMVAGDFPPINKSDVLIMTQLLSAPAAVEAFMEYAIQCQQVLPKCQPERPPGGIINNVTPVPVPGPGGQCCPPNNVIINIPAPKAPIDNVPVGPTPITEPPTYPYDPGIITLPGGNGGPGTYVNINLPPNQDCKLDNQPAGPNQPNAAELDVGTGKICQDWDQWAAQFDGKTVKQILTNMDIIDDQGFLAALSPMAKGWGWPSPFSYIPVALAAFISLPFTVFFLVWSTVQGTIFEKFCKHAGALIATTIQRSSIKWLGRLLGAETRQAETRIQKQENYFCPVETPGVEAANLARFRGQIGQEEWRCWVRMANLDESYAEKIYFAERELLSPIEYRVAWQRGLLDDDALDKALDQRGMINDFDKALTKELGTFYPGVTDILHFIVRGIGDPQIVQRFGLLDEFDLLYTGDLVTLGEAAGIKKETMELYHAAHWVVPAPGQLFTMLQRLRPDNMPQGQAVKDWEVTSEDVNRALRENAYAPFWRSRLEAIAYNPISRRDLLQIYQHGKIDDDGLVSRFQDLGFTADNANVIAETYKARVFDAIRKEEWIKWYEVSAVTRQQAGDQLVSLGYDSLLVNNALDYADDVADAKTRIVCLKYLAREYALGGIDATTGQQLLLGAGLDTRQVLRQLTQWDCTKRARPKSIPAATLCKWYSGGLISSGDFAARLVRVGYDPADANRIVMECLSEQSAKRLAARQRALRQQSADQIRQARAGAYIEKQKVLALSAEKKSTAKALNLSTRAEAALLTAQSKAKSLADREASAASRKAVAESRAEERLEARLQAAAEKFAARTGLDSGTVSGWIVDAWSRLQSDNGLDSDTALTAAILAAADKRAIDQDSYLGLVQSAGQAAATIEQFASAPASPANPPSPSPSSPLETQRPR